VDELSARTGGYALIHIKDVSPFRILFYADATVLGRTVAQNNHCLFGAAIPGSGGMAKFITVGLSYEALRKECLETIRQWPGCESIAGIQIIRDSKPGKFSVRITLYGNANVKMADRAIACVQREKRRQFHLI
jgi:hypothetical protein